MSDCWTGGSRPSISQPCRALPLRSTKPKMQSNGRESQDRPVRPQLHYLPNRTPQMQAVRMIIDVAALWRMELHHRILLDRSVYSQK